MNLIAASADVVAQHIIDGISLGCLYALLALGLALIFGVLGLLNWAYGELIMIGGYTLVLLSGLAMPVLVPLMILVVVAVSLLLERVAFRPVRTAPAETMLITSFGVSFLLQSLALLIFTATGKSAEVADDLLRPVSVAGISFPLLDVVIVGVGGVLLIGLLILLTRCRLGVELRAAAADFEMAQLLGVRADRVIAIAFVLSGVLAAVAAFLLTVQTGLITPNFGLAPVIVAFVAVILGGMGSLPGGALGGFVVGALSVALQALLPEELRPFRDAFLYLCVFAMLAVRPHGLIVARSGVRRV